MDDSDDIRPIRYLDAGEFVCEDCGAKNFFSLGHFTKSSLPQTTREVIPPEVLERADEDTVFVINPDWVKCRQCGAKFDPYQSPEELADEAF